jgi:hypothetical protein
MTRQQRHLTGHARNDRGLLAVWYRDLLHPPSRWLLLLYGLVLAIHAESVGYDREPSDARPPGRRLPMQCSVNRIWH